MKTRAFTRLALLSVVAATLFQSGCSALGFGIGAVFDPKGPDISGIADQEVVGIAVGTQLEIILKDGRRISGRYRGVFRKSDETDEPRGSKVPLISQIALETETGTSLVALEDVDYLRLPTKRGRQIGFLVGLVLDVLVIIGMSTLSV